MTHEERFFSGDVMTQHWSDEDGGVAVMAAKKKAAKKGAKKATKKPKPEADSPRPRDAAPPRRPASASNLPARTTAVGTGPGGQP